MATLAVPWWRSAIRRTSDRPSPAPPAPPAPRLRCSSRRTNRSNTRSRSASGIPGPSSSTSTRTRPSRSCTDTRTVLPGVAAGVVEQVRQRPAQLHAAALHHRRRGRVDLHRHAGVGRARAAGLLAGLVGEVDRDGVGQRGALVEGGEQQQVGDDRLEPGLLGEQPVGHRRPLLGRGGALGHLELGADGGHRAAQLVGGVGDEPLLADEASSSRSSMAFIVCGQPGHLVAGVGHGHPAVERGAADGLDLGPDRLDRPQGAPGEHPGEAARHPRRAAGTRPAGRLRTASTLRSMGSSGEAATSSTNPELVCTSAVVRRTESSAELLVSRGGGDLTAVDADLEVRRATRDHHLELARSPALLQLGPQLGQALDVLRRAGGRAASRRRCARATGPRGARPTPPRRWRRAVRRTADRADTAQASSTTRYPAPRTVTRLWRPKGASILRRR